MNNIVSKIILGFLFGLFFVVLSFYTFFSSEKEIMSAPNFDITKIGEKKLDGIISDKVSLYTTIYSKNKDYNIEKNTITVGTGVYFIDSRDVFSKITIKMGTNDLLLNGGGMVYINNNSKYKTITSFNNKVEINFHNKDKNKSGIKMFLYPHMYIKFIPSRFIKEEKADSLRVSQLSSYNLKYFNQNFTEFLKQEKIDFIDNKNLEFFKISLNDIIKKQKKYSNKLKEIKTKEILNIDSIDYIEKYFVLFYNDRKKVVYYKNITLKLLIDLLNTGDKKDIEKILNNLKLIKNLDLEEYSKMQNFVKEIFFLVSYDLSDKSDLIQDSYDLLISKIFNINDTRKIKLIKDVDKYNYLGDFSKFLYLSVLNIENKDLSLLDKEYYILFKQNILVSNFANSNLKQKFYNILLKGFVSYTENIEKNIKVEEKDNFLSNVRLNVFLLEQLSLSLKNRYFEENRNSQDLLLLKEKNGIGNIEEFKKAVENIFNKYEKAKIDFEKRKSIDGIYIVKYNILKKKLKEYIDALYNYSLYTKKYSKVNKIISNVKVYEGDEEVLTKEKFIKFISEFYGINLSTINLEVSQDYYKINNISINGEDFSFDLFPYSGNLIQNIIYKNNQKLIGREIGFYDQLESTSYELDKEKEKYKELYQKVKNEEKEKYDFRNFFLNTFFMKNTKKVEEYFGDDKNSNNDDEIIQTFKNAKLLGNKGEFRNIKDILDIKYGNLDVERKSGEIFIIQIKNANLKVNVQQKFDRKDYGAILNSNYKLEDNKHYFYNIKLNPYIKGTFSDNKYIFKEVDLKIRGKIELVNFKEKMKKLFSEIPEIKEKYNELIKTKKINNITYNIITGKYYFR